MKTPAGFDVRVLQGLRANFKQPSGPSRAGTDWAISLSNARGESTILVRTYADEVGPLSEEEEARLALEFIGQLIESGWTPEQYRGEPGELVAHGSTSTAVRKQDFRPKKSWWQFW